MLRRKRNKRRGGRGRERRREVKGEEKREGMGTQGG